MNEQTRQILIGQLGTLIVANAELAAENVALARKWRSPRIWKNGRRRHRP
jgi:hypothetical protein